MGEVLIQLKCKVEYFDSLIIEFHKIQTETKTISKKEMVSENTLSEIILKIHLFACTKRITEKLQPQLLIQNNNTDSSGNLNESHTREHYLSSF